MAYQNLPGTVLDLLDGNLQVVPVNRNPVIAVIGTASRGDDGFYRVESAADAARVYGRGSGTLIRGLYEVSAGGGQNIRLMRIGGKPTIVEGIGALISDPEVGFPGLRLETALRDESTGSDFSVFYQGSTGRLRVKRVSDGELVYDNSPGVPAEFVDLGEVIVDGTPDVGYATGSVTWVDDSLLLDGERVTVGDGNGHTINFWVSLDGLWAGPVGGYGPSDVELDIPVPSTAAAVADIFRAAVNGSALEVTADATGLALVELTNDNLGSVGNVTITETVANAGLVVSGMLCQKIADVGTLGAYELLEDLEDAHGVGDGPTLSLGADGTSLSRMELFEALHRAYGLLEDQEIDYMVPMDVYLDDLNVMDMDADAIANRSLVALNAYPSAGNVNDVLGLCHIEELDGESYFWWHFPSDATNISATPTANIFPTVGSADATHGITGTVLEDADYHEVNFGYQLANFLHVQGTNSDSMQGFIGVKGPISFSLRGVSNWVGQLPTYEEDVNGNLIVATGGNGSGLLGNKWLAGRENDGTLPGFAINGVDGLAYGGFIATDSGEIDGTHLEDDNDKLVDIGKYLSVVQAHVRMANPSSSRPYIATYAPMYAGLCSNLSPDSAPTNKPVMNASLPYRVNKTKLDTLAGLRYIALHARRRNLVIADAPTAARPDSDYTRFSTFSQVRAAVDAIREAAEPFLGEGMTGTLMAALETALDKAMKALVKLGVISSFSMQLISTPVMRVRGQALVELKLVPAFEFRQLTVRVALAATI